MSRDPQCKGSTVFLRSFPFDWRKWSKGESKLSVWFSRPSATHLDHLIDVHQTVVLCSFSQVFFVFLAHPKQCGSLLLLSWTVFQAPAGSCFQQKQNILNIKSHTQHDMTDKVSPTLRKKVSHQAAEEQTMFFMSWWRPKKSYKESKAASKCPKGLDWPLAVQAHNLSCPQGISSGFSEDSQRVRLGSNTHHDTVIMYVGVKVIEASKLILFL